MKRMEWHESGITTTFDVAMGEAVLTIPYEKENFSSVGMSRWMVDGEDDQSCDK